MAIGKALSFRRFWDETASYSLGALKSPKG